MAMSKTSRRARASGLLVRQNVRLARSLWSGELSPLNILELKKLSRNSRLSVGSGEVLLLGGKWYITNSGLLRLAQERHCLSIQTRAIVKLCDSQNGRWVFKATVYKSPGSKGFAGYGDADPSNVSPLVRGAEMRVAETRAVNRALRKAYGIGLCSVEELGWLTGPAKPSQDRGKEENSPTPNGPNNGQPRLRDRLCLLIRQHNLDPRLVKAYAADFCGTPSLKEANRDLVESFISHLAVAAKEDRDALLCKINSYAQAAEAKS